MIKIAMKKNDRHISTLYTIPRQYCIYYDKMVEKIMGTGISI